MKKLFPVLEYINIPNAITTIGLLFGIAACYFLIVEADLRLALLCIFLAMLMDLFDGFLAEKLSQQTEFGQYVDSLVDFFICCIIPIILVYTFVGSYFLSLVSLGFYSICGLWRLAYYNVRESDNIFIGLPVPGAMLLVSMAVWSVQFYNAPSWIIYVMLFIGGLLMISFVKLPKYGLWQKLFWLLGLVFFVVVVMA